MLRRATRRYMFWIVVICYLITATILIGFARGYRVTLFPFIVARTGNVRVSFEPRDAVAHLDARNITNGSPANARSVFPGIHTVRIVKKNYLPFQKTVRVIPLITTFVENISLVPDAPVLPSDVPLAPPSEDAREVSIGGLFARRVHTAGRVDFFSSDTPDENETPMFSLSGIHLRAHKFFGGSFILVYTPFELWSVNVRTGAPLLIARLSSPIRAVAPVPDSGMVIISTPETIGVFQLGDSSPELFQLISGTDIRDAQITDDGVLLFTDLRQGIRSVFQRPLR